MNIVRTIQYIPLTNSLGVRVFKSGEKVKRNEERGGEKLKVERIEHYCINDTCTFFCWWWAGGSWQEWNIRILHKKLPTIDYGRHVLAS